MVPPLSVARQAFSLKNRHTCTSPAELLMRGAHGRYGSRSLSCGWQAEAGNVYALLDIPGALSTLGICPAGKEGGCRRESSALTCHHKPEGDAEGDQDQGAVPDAGLCEAEGPLYILRHRHVPPLHADHCLIVVQLAANHAVQRPRSCAQHCCVSAWRLRCRAPLKRTWTCFFMATFWLCICHQCECRSPITGGAELDQKPDHTRIQVVVPVPPHWNLRGRNEESCSDQNKKLRVLGPGWQMPGMGMLVHMS